MYLKSLNLRARKKQKSLAQENRKMRVHHKSYIPLFCLLANKQKVSINDVEKKALA